MKRLGGRDEADIQTQKICPLDAQGMPVLSTERLIGLHGLWDTWMPVLPKRG